MSKNLLVIDTETGGLDPERNSILSLAGVVFDGRTVFERPLNTEPLDVAHLFITEETIVADARALEVNKIDLEAHKRKGKTPAAAVKKFERFLDKNFGTVAGEVSVDNVRGSVQWGMSSPVSLVGHNANFDYGFLRRLYRLAGRESLFRKRFSHRLTDTAGIMRFLMLAGKMPQGGASLDEGIRHFGINVPAGDRHTALGDAKATAELLLRLIRQVAR